MTTGPGCSLGQELGGPPQTGGESPGCEAPSANWGAVGRRWPTFWKEKRRFLKYPGPLWVILLDWQRLCCRAGAITPEPWTSLEKPAFQKTTETIQTGTVPNTAGKLDGAPQPARGTEPFLLQPLP